MRVDLVSAVHVADASYYADLQSRLESYDRVLYELVADKRRPTGSGAAPAGRWRPQPLSPTRSRRGRGLVGAAQRFMATALRLEFQLEQLDYCALPFCACCARIKPARD